MRFRQNRNGRCGKTDFSPGLDKVSGGKKKKVAEKQNSGVRIQKPE
jgi:hypothetical protein